MFCDFLLIANWWLIFLGLGLLVLPLSSKIFDKFFDKGYIFAKIIGLGLLSYISWLLAALKIVAFGSWSVVVIIGIWCIYYFISKKHIELIIIIKEKWKIFLLEEILFLVVFTLWSFLRGFSPAADNLEKFMDLGFINSIYRTKYMPPADMWFAGKTINYYYFGHFMTALMTKISGVGVAAAFNMMLGAITSFAFVMAFSLGANLYYFWKKEIKTSVFVGVLTGALMVFGGNLHTVVYGGLLPILKSIGWYSGAVKDYWYSDATRYIGYNPPTNDKTIHEFPSYSFVVADLHGHVLDIIFVLVMIGILLAILHKEYLAQKLGKIRFFPWEYFILSVFLAMSAMTNFWDYPIYLALTGVILLIKFAKMGKFGNAIYFAFVEWVKIFGVSAVFLSPFLTHFTNISQGVHLVTHRSLYYQLIVLWGVPVMFFVIFIAILLSRLPKERRRWFRKITLSDSAILALGGMGILLVLAPEFIYMKDIYSDGYQRANTMFKLTFQAYIMFTITLGYLTMRIIEASRKGWVKVICGIVCFGLIFVLFWFPFYSINTFYGKLTKSRYKGIDSLKYLEKESPKDWAMIGWLNGVKGQPVILEADGDSYSKYGRISMATGLPTVMGWLVHEWLWRGSYNEPAGRIKEVEEIYTSGNLKTTKELIKKYKIKYVIVGDLEREKYSELNMQKISKLGKVVFNAGDSEIIEIN